MRFLFTNKQNNASTNLFQTAHQSPVPEKSRRVRPAAKRDQAENKMSVFAKFRII